MLRRAIAASVAACWLWVVLACAPAPNTAPRDALSLVWISLDTLRADHVSLYGYARDTTPFLDALAREGAYVRWAVSPQTATLPTHVTQFTGHHPVVHGVMHSTQNPGVRLRDEVRTLPEVLRDAGFRNRAWVDGGQMAGRFGFARGFERYDDAFTPFPAKLDAAVEFIAGLAPEERFFVFVQTYEIHSPYAPPPAYRRLFVTPGERDLATRSLDLYDGSIRFADDALRAFVADLDLAERLESTVLVVTGDHGEHFAEYGVDLIGHHGQLLRQNLTRVPWIVRHPDPRMRARVVDTAGLVDFANATLSLLGLAERLPGGGRAVFDETPAEEPVYLSWAGPAAWSLQRGELHYLESETAGPARNGLFDVGRDPLERAPLSDRAREAEMAALLEAERRRLVEQAARLQASLMTGGELDDALVEQLRALGYAVEPAVEPGDEDGD